MPLALYVDAHEAAPPDRFLVRAARSGGVVLLGTRDPLPHISEGAFTVDVDKPTTAEQEAAWRASLPTEDHAPESETTSEAASATATEAEHIVAAEHATEAEHATDAARATEAAHAGVDDEESEDADRPATAGELAAQFSFNLPDIYVIAESAVAARAGGEPQGAELGDAWELCKARTRQRLDILAERLEPKAKWRDIVLGEEPKRLLRAIAHQVRQRNTVYEEWGFARRMNRGLGISALFAGESGTGKTMAAEVIANDLRLNLYRIDLSAVVSKYIGETEKNLRRLFDAAESGGTILFFDEADALFGKRSEVKDSHDRYANIEINYLLQRMEAYGGLAILATNMKSALDQAFMRRLRFIVNFSFPGAAERRLM
jgi:ATP-dependent Zn protease